MSESLYNIPLRRLDGGAATLAEYRGRVLLIVNVASKCGLTPQYTALQRLHTSYVGRGLSVLGFPCNDFAAQEPGTETEIREFCDSQYGVTFTLFGKVNINSSPRHPLYTHLIIAQPKADSSTSSSTRQTRLAAQKQRRCSVEFRDVSHRSRWRGSCAFRPRCHP